MDITELLKGEQPRLIDEWQDAPKFWDAIRFDVDHSPGWGHYILTGSAVPPGDKNERSQVRVKPVEARRTLVGTRP